MKLLRRAGLLALLLHAAGNALAGEAGVMVVIDNSGSMQTLRKSYLADMAELFSAAQDTRFVIRTIGHRDIRVDPAPGTSLAGALEQQIGFNEGTTPLDASLRRAEQDPMFAASDGLIILTDFDPDYQDTLRPWRFTDPKEAKDLNNSLRRLRAWLEAGKSIDLLLHDWTEAELPKRSLAPRGGWGEIEQRLKRLERSFGGDAVSEPPKALASAALSQLLAEFGAKFNLLPVIGGDNQEDFHLKLCGILKPRLAARWNEVCVGGSDSNQGPLRALLILNDLLTPAQVSEKVRPGLVGQLYAGSIPMAVEWEILDTAPPADDTRRWDFTAEVNAPSDDDLKETTLRLTGLSIQGGKGNEIELGTARPKDFIGNTNELAFWSLDQVNDAIKAFQARYRPPAERSKRIWLKTADASPAPDGLYFHVRYQFADGATKRSADRRSENGFIRVSLPEGFDKAWLVWADGGEELAPITPAEVRNKQDIHKGLPAITGRVQVTWGPKPPPAELKVLMRIFRDTSSGPIQVGEDHQLQSGGINGIELPRGRYHYALIPINDTSLLGYVIETAAIEVKGGDTKLTLPDLRPDQLAQGWNAALYEFATYQGKIGEWYPKTPEVREHLYGSAWYLNRLLEETSRIWSSPGADRSAIRDQWRAVRWLVFWGPSAQGLRQWWDRTLFSLSLLDEDGRPRQNAFTLLSTAMDRIIGDSADRISAPHRLATDYRRWIDYLNREGMIGKELRETLLAPPPPADLTPAKGGERPR